MASSDSQTPRRFGHRMIWLALAIVIMIAAYVAGWYYVADRVHAEVAGTVTALNRDGRRANCENAEIRGFPFRIGVFCRSVLYEDARAGVGFRARELRSAAQIYAPQRIVAELDGPALVEFPGINAVDVDWTSLRSSVRLANPIPDLVSIEAQDLRADLDSYPTEGESLVAVDSAEFHMRPNGPDLDLAVRFAGLRPDRSATGGNLLPAMQGLADLSIDGAARGFAGNAGLRGRSGTVRNLTVTFDGDEGAQISGPFAVDADGLVDARLEITLQDPTALAATLGEAFPDLRSQINAAFSGLAALGDEPTLPLTITRGNARLGFLSLGEIPPLD